MIFSGAMKRCFLLWLAAALTASAQPALLHVRVSLGDVSLNKVPFLIADDTGIYKRNGLDVEQLITPNAAAAVRRSGINVPDRYISKGPAGPTEISIAGGSPTIISMIGPGRSIDRVILATTDDEARWTIVAAPGITSVEQLKGKRLGYSSRGSVSHFIALAFAQKMGWTPDRDITLVGGSLSVDALKEGRVDAAIADEIVQAQAPAAGFKSVVDLRPYHIPLPGSGVVASREWLKNNPEAARRFLKSMLEAMALMQHDSTVSAAAMAKWFGITDPARQREIWTQAADLPRKPYPSVAGIRKMLELYNDPGLTGHKPEDFFDASFIAELDRSGFIDKLYAAQ